MFQHTATRRWLRQKFDRTFLPFDVSTHSHPKVAAFGISYTFSKILVSTHSHPKVAALRVEFCIYRHSCFNTQPPEGGCRIMMPIHASYILFQHTATRRWLLMFIGTDLTNIKGFNTQPPEGGCYPVAHHVHAQFVFQHTATRRWLLASAMATHARWCVSTHSHPKVAASHN